MQLVPQLQCSSWCKVSSLTMSMYCTAALQGYELVQGTLARWSEVQKGQRAPPTVVMLHGILGSRKNMQAFAHRLVEVSCECVASSMLVMPLK